MERRAKQYENNWCVYMHENRINGKKYIGITSQKPTRRWQNGYGYRESARFFNAIQKYGWDAFRHEILFTDLTAEEAARKEVELIEKYQTLDEAKGYNLDPGGGGTAPKTPEVRQRISEARKGTHPSAETIEKLRESHRGKTVPDEVRRKMSAAALGVKKSEEHCRNIGRAHSKAVVMQDAQGQDLREFDSMVAAEAATGVSFKQISAVCRGKRKKAGGYIWRFKTESPSTLAT